MNTATANTVYGPRGFRTILFSNAKDAAAWKPGLFFHMGLMMALPEDRRPAFRADQARIREQLKVMTKPELRNLLEELGRSACGIQKAESLRMYAEDALMEALWPNVPQVRQ